MYRSSHSSTKHGIESALLFLGIAIAVNGGLYLITQQNTWVLYLSISMSCLMMAGALYVSVIQIRSNKNWFLEINESGINHMPPSDRVADTFEVSWSEIDYILKEMDSGEADQGYSLCVILKDGKTLGLSENSPFDMDEIAKSIEQYDLTKIIDNRKFTNKHLGR